MENAHKNSLFEQYRKRFKFKQRLWNVLSIVYTLILIQLLRFLDGRDYGVIWRIISIVVTAALIIMNLIQSRSMKRQLDALSEASAEKIAAELESCEEAFEQKSAEAAGFILASFSVKPKPIKNLI